MEWKVYDSPCNEDWGLRECDVVGTVGSGPKVEADNAADTRTTLCQR